MAFSQLHLTPFAHYESAWRTENTGSNPVGSEPESLRARLLCVNDQGGAPPAPSSRPVARGRCPSRSLPFARKNKKRQTEAKYLFLLACSIYLDGDVTYRRPF